jgi:hypothetical protein
VAVSRDTSASYYCTFFDRNYLARALALYDSLAEHTPSFHIWMLCMDDESLAALRWMGLEHATPMSSRDVEMHDGRLESVKESRSRAEYYFTIKSFFISLVLESLPEGLLLTYIDADMFFFSRLDTDDPAIMKCSIMLSPHRFPPNGLFRECFGIYNAGMVSVRRDARGDAFLAWWREQCIDWCYDRVEDGRFADQKYLDQVPRRFDGVGLFSRKGINLAPWNLGNIAVGLHGGRLMADGDPLTLFHFHGLRDLGNGKYDSNARHFKYRMTPVLREKIFKPYVNALKKEEARLAGHCLPILSVDRQAWKNRNIPMSMPDVFQHAIRWVLDLYYRSTFRVPPGSGESRGNR